MAGASLWRRAYWSMCLARHLAGQARIPYRRIEAIRRAQSRRVRAVVRHAYRTVPYYRESMERMGLDPSDFRRAEDLAKLPLLHPGQLQGDPGYFTSTADPLSGCIKVRTGGSTGDPRDIYHSTCAVIQNAAHGERDRSVYLPLVGRAYGYRETMLISANCTAPKLQDFLRSKTLLPGGAIRRQQLSLFDPPEKNVPLMNAFRPHVVHSYGSYLGMLFSYLADTGASFHRPRVITYSSDGLSEPSRRLIQDKFGIPVFGAYQANEALKLGFECEMHTGLHLNVDLYPLRVVDPDGRDMPSGETGEVVVSNLVNRGTVLLNYRLGDLAALIPGSCSCGRSLPLLTFPPGRSDDLIRLPSGRIVHPQAARTLFITEEHIRQFQIVQDADLHFTVKLMASPDADRSALSRRLYEKFAERFGPGSSMDIRFVDAIERTSAGKFRPVISLAAASDRRADGGAG